MTMKVPANANVFIPATFGFGLGVSKNHRIIFTNRDGVTVYDLGPATQQHVRALVSALNKLETFASE